MAKEIINLENIKLGEGGTIKSVDLVGIINTFRAEEGRSNLQHKHLTEKIRKELNTLEKLGINGQPNFRPTSYIDVQGKKCSCFELDDDGMMMMLSSESTLVRYQTTQYIKQLKEKLSKAQEDNEQLRDNNKKLFEIGMSEQDEATRQYELKKERYKIKNIKNVLLECDYSNIIDVALDIVDFNSEVLKASDRYEAHKNKTKTEYKQHVRKITRKFVEEVMGEKAMKDPMIVTVGYKLMDILSQDTLATTNRSYAQRK